MHSDKEILKCLALYKIEAQVATYNQVAALKRLSASGFALYNDMGGFWVITEDGRQAQERDAAFGLCEDVADTNIIHDDRGRHGTGEIRRQWGKRPSYQAAKFPTPLSAPTTKASHNQLLGRYREKMNEITGGGSLNPMWVEWLMGVPIGWAGCCLLYGWR